MLWKIYKVFDHIIYKILDWFFWFKIRLNGKQVAAEWSAVIDAGEARVEPEILQILGCRNDYSITRLYDHYTRLTHVLIDPDKYRDDYPTIDDMREEITHEFTMDECRKIVTIDSCFLAFTEEYLHVYRNGTDIKGIMEKRVKFHEMLEAI